MRGNGVLQVAGQRAAARGSSSTTRRNCPRRHRRRARSASPSRARIVNCHLPDRAGDAADLRGRQARRIATTQTFAGAGAAHHRRCAATLCGAVAGRDPRRADDDHRAALARRAGRQHGASPARWRRKPVTHGRHLVGEPVNALVNLNRLGAQPGAAALQGDGLRRVHRAATSPSCPPPSPRRDAEPPAEGLSRDHGPRRRLRRRPRRPHRLLPERRHLAAAARRVASSRRRRPARAAGRRSSPTTTSRSSRG